MTTSLPSFLRLRYGDLLRTYLAPQRARVALLSALLLTTTTMFLIHPQILRAFIDTAVGGGAGGTLLQLACLFLVVTIVDQGLWVATNYVGENVGWTATNALRADLARHCLDLDMSFHNARTPGELIERIDGDTTALANFFSRFIILVLGSVLLLVGVLAMLFREDWRVGLALSAYALVGLLALHRLRRFAVPYLVADRQASAEMYGFLEERLAGVPDIHANGAQPYVLRRFHEFMRRRYRRGRAAYLAESVMFNTANGLFLVGYVLALGLGAALFQAGELTIGTVYLIFHYTDLLRFPLEQITQQLQDYQRASASIGRVEELRTIQSSTTDGAGGTLPPGPLAVAFERVSFAYPETKDEGRRTNGPRRSDSSFVSRPSSVLHSVSFALSPGEVLGVLGRTGSGKTTLTRLLFRFYDPSEGAVLLGGVDTRRLRLEDLRRAVGIVTQEVQLFQATVRDNLTLFDRSIPDQSILRVLAELGLDVWYGALPAGLDTELASGGRGLSAGEAQLLALARAFLRDPAVVVLDEASARLDPATEALLEHAIGRLLGGRTGIVIAHRLATLQRADDILILEQGRVREYGPRRDLAADRRSRFAQLLEAGLEEVLV